jgi:hypothetical protein
MPYIEWALRSRVELTVLSDNQVLITRISAPGAFVLSVDDATGIMSVNGVPTPDLPNEYSDVIDSALMGPPDQTIGRTIIHDPKDRT